LADQSWETVSETSTDELSGVVQELKLIHQRSGIAAVAAVGELVLSRFFAGSVEAFQSAERRKDRSLRRLARCEGCPYSKSALHQAVRIHLVRLTNPIVQTYGHIGPSHIAVTLVLMDSERNTLLAVAETQRWSVRQLRQEVVRVQNHANRGTAKRRGRPKQAQAERALSVVRQSIEFVNAAVEGALSQPLSSNTRTQLRHALSELETQCQSLLMTLEHSGRPTLLPPLESTVEVIPPSRGTPRNTTKRVVNGPWGHTHN
jgi:hypothetical protein